MPDELLSSWLVRLAHAHHTKVHTFGQLLFPGISLWNRDVDKMAPVDVLHTLSIRTDTLLSRLHQTTLPPLIGRLNGEPLMAGQASATWLMPLGIYHRTRRGHGLVYCPSCLQQDGPTPYYRVSWRIAFYVVCPTCGIYLHECCPACGAPVVFFRTELGHKNTGANRPISTCYRCAFELGQAPVEVVPLSILRRYRSLYRISREGWNHGVFYPHQYLRVLRQLLRLLSSPSQLVQPLQADLRLRLGQSVEFSADITSFERLPIARRSCLLEQAMWLLADWPDRFIAVMRYHRVSSTPLLRDMQEVPFWFSTVVTEQFYVTNVNRRFVTPVPERCEKGRNQYIAPIKGLAGAPRKYDAERNCPRCHSDWISRNGYKAGRQQYECQQCGRHFAATTIEF